MGRSLLFAAIRFFFAIFVFFRGYPVFALVWGQPPASTRGTRRHSFAVDLATELG
jgi:hypothetical protein